MKSMTALIMTFALAVSCSKPVADQKLTPRKDIVLTKSQQEMVSSGNAFAFNLMKEVMKENDGKSWVMSPLSVQYALGMVLNGAVGETAGQISSVLGYGTDGKDEVNLFCKTLSDGISAVDPSTAVNIANVAVYNTHGTEPLEKPFEEALAEYYQAGVESFDFTTDNGAALRRINAWSSEKTRGMIPSILDEVSEDALAYFLNAVYFKGMWSHKFNRSNTSAETFTTSGGSSISVDMMHQSAEFGYADMGKYKVLSMPYGNGAFRMSVILPDGKVSLDDLAATLDSDVWNSISHLPTREVDVKFPRFETKSDHPLNDALQALGMVLPFKPGADFSAMSKSADRISKVFQKARIKVDEEGSEAAAVTVVEVLKVTALPDQEYCYFHADHPFLYVISEVSTGAVMFMGAFTGK